MGKIKDIFKGPHRKFAWFVVIVTGLFAILWVVGPGNTVIHWAKAGAEIRRQEKIIKEYEAQNAEMDRRIDRLMTDRKNSPESSSILLSLAKMSTLLNDVSRILCRSKGLSP